MSIPSLPLLHLFLSFFVFFFLFTLPHTLSLSHSLSLHRQSRDILPRFSWLVFDKLDDFPYSAPSSPILPALLRLFSCCSCRGLVNFGLQCPQTLGFPPPIHGSVVPPRLSTRLLFTPCYYYSNLSQSSGPSHHTTSSFSSHFLLTLSLSLSLPPADSLGFFLPTLYFIFFFQPTDHDLSPFAKVSFPL